MDIELKERAIKALQRTWEYIENDWLQLFESGQCSQLDIFKAVVDNGRLQLYGDDLEAANWFYDQIPPTRQKICKEAFPNKTYGWLGE